MVGHTPFFMEELSKCVTGIDSSVENFLSMEVGMSSGGTDFLTSSAFKTFLTFAFENYSIELSR